MRLLRYVLGIVACRCLVRNSRSRTLFPFCHDGSIGCAQRCPCLPFCWWCKPKRSEELWSSCPFSSSSYFDGRWSLASGAFTHALRQGLPSLPRHFFPERHEVWRLHPQGLVRQYTTLSCCQGHDHVPGNVECKTKEHTALAPGSIGCSQTETSPLLVPNVSIAQMCCSSNISWVKRSLRDFSPNVMKCDTNLVCQVARPRSEVLLSA